MKQQQTDLSNRNNTLKVSNNQNPNTRNNNFNPQQTGKYRFNNQRRFRGRGFNNDKGRGRFDNNRGYFNGNQNRNYNSYSNYNTPQLQESTNQEHIAETRYSKQVLPLWLPELLCTRLQPKENSK